uniref:eRF1 domain-containing protein n=1 Tax=Fagus sylvatica TaxID=28930 RepID=A0A2N9G312_FAGSY
MSSKNFPSSCKALEILILTLHGRGRQDALKFASLMRHNYMRKTAELDTQFFIDPGTNQPTVSGLILAVQLNSRLSSASQICLILDYMYVFKNSVIKYLNHEQEADRNNFLDPATSSELEVQEVRSFIEWSRCELEFVNNQSLEGSQFCRGLGGIRAILRVQKHRSPGTAVEKIRIDQLILSALISSLSEHVLAYVVKCPTSCEVWNTLERMFTAQSRARSMHIHYQLATLRKGDSSVADYYHRFTNLIDTLAAIDQPVPHHEQLSFLLAGLGPDFDSLVTSVKTQFHPVPLEDIYGHLLSHELRLSHNQPSVDLSNASANFVNKGTSNHSGRSGGRSSSNFSSNRGRSNWNNQRGRGRGRPNFSNTSNRPVCQVCHKIGHVALQCYHRFNNTYTMDNTPQMQALLATPQQAVDPNWYPDSRCHPSSYS